MLLDWVTMRTKSEERIPLKVWKMMTPDARITMHSVKEVEIGIVKNSAAKTVKHGGGKMPQQHKKAREKFPQLTQA